MNLEMKVSYFTLNSITHAFNYLLHSFKEWSNDI